MTARTTPHRGRVSLADESGRSVETTGRKQRQIQDTARVIRDGKSGGGSIVSRAQDPGGSKIRRAVRGVSWGFRSNAREALGWRKSTLAALAKSGPNKNTQVTFLLTWFLLTQGGEVIAGTVHSRRKRRAVEARVVVMPFVSSVGVVRVRGRTISPRLSPTRDCCVTFFPGDLWVRRQIDRSRARYRCGWWCRRPTNTGRDASSLGRELRTRGSLGGSGGSLRSALGSTCSVPTASRGVTLDGQAHVARMENVHEEAVAALRLMIDSSGGDPAQYPFYSGIIVGGGHLAAQGVPELQIQRAGRWSRERS